MWVWLIYRGVWSIYRCVINVQVWVWLIYRGVCDRTGACSWSEHCSSSDSYRGRTYHHGNTVPQRAWWNLGCSIWTTIGPNWVQCCEAAGAIIITLTSLIRLVWRLIATFGLSLKIDPESEVDFYFALSKSFSPDFGLSDLLIAKFGLSNLLSPKFGLSDSLSPKSIWTGLSAIYFAFKRYVNLLELNFRWVEIDFIF